MNLRIANNADREGVHQIHLAAFGEEENEVVANLAVKLLTENSAPKTINLVAEIDGILVGHVVFSPVRLKTTQQPFGYILAPLAIKPEYQKSGIGSKLVENGLQLLRQQNTSIVFVYGDPKYYSRFGFVADLALRFPPPYPLQYPTGWQAMELPNKNDLTTKGPIECVTPLSQSEMW